MVDKIRELFSLTGKSLFSLEKECGFGNGTINKWDKSSPSIDRVSKVAAALGVTVGDILGEKNTAPISEDGKAEILSIFDSLSLDRRSKLIELARLYLADQRKSEEMK